MGEARGARRKGGEAGKWGKGVDGGGWNTYQKDVLRADRSGAGVLRLTLGTLGNPTVFEFMVVGTIRSWSVSALR